MNMCAQRQRQYFLVAIVVLLSLLRASHGAETAVPTMPYGNSDSDQHVYECQQRQGGCTILGRHNNESSSTPRDVDSFYPWDPNEDSLMNALYPDHTRLQAAWEVHPLLSKVSFTQPRLKTQPLNSIPTIFHNRTSSLKYEKDPILSLFSIDDAIEVVNHPHMAHGSDYKLMKRVTKHRGDEWEGMLPEYHCSVDELIKYVQTEGMSLAINDMQHRWKSIGRMARRMEQELGVGDLNVNLYLTPEVRLDENSMKKNDVTMQATPPHWDMMDVFIIQLAGRKRWSVAREPTIYLSNRDTKRTPTTEEIKHFAQENQFLEFTLCPGDVLYIPRGHIHNASTVVFDQLKRKWEDWDTCPTYPKDLVGADPLGGRLDVPSLHLTFGCNNDFTVESLVHYALYSYFADARSSSTRYNKHSVVIPAGTCSSPAQKAMQYDVTWELVLHHSLAELARRESNCDNGIPVKQRRECGATATLRQGVSFLLLTNNELDLSRSDAPKQERLRNLESTYLEALDTLISSSILHKTIDFIQSHILQLSTDQGGAFHFPGYHKEKHAILCPSALSTLQEVELLHRLEDFVQFAKINFFKALKWMNPDGKMGREMERTGCDPPNSQGGGLNLNHQQLRLPATYESSNGNITTNFTFPSPQMRLKYYMGDWYGRTLHPKDIPCHEIQASDRIFSDKPVLWRANKLNYEIQNNRHKNWKIGAYLVNAYSVIKRTTSVNEEDKRLILHLGDSHSHSTKLPVVAKTRFSKFATSKSTGKHFFNPIIFPLDMDRHYHEYINEYVRLHKEGKVTKWKDKKSTLIWRGGVTGVQSDLDKRFLTTHVEGGRRLQVVKDYFHRDISDVDVAFKKEDGVVQWVPFKYKRDVKNLARGSHTSMADQLKFKYILTLEGNDVATGLKWQLASNSVVFMAKPTTVSFLMEDLLVPFVHYVPLKDDYSNIIEMVHWARSNDNKCKWISEQATLFMQQLWMSKKAKSDNAVIQKELGEAYQRQFGEAVKSCKYIGVACPFWKHGYGELSMSADY